MKSQISVMLVLLVFAGAAFSTGSPGPSYTPLSCGDTISVPGFYNLTSDQQNDLNSTCIQIYSDNATLDCQGRFINDSDFSSSNIGVDAYGTSPEAPLNNFTLQNCVFYNFNTAIRAYYLNDSLISRNNISIPDDNGSVEHTAGVDLEYSHLTNVTGNDIRGTPGLAVYSMGIYSFSVNGSWIIGNTVANVTSGIMFDYSYAGSSSNNNLISGNTVKSLFSNGIELGGGDSNTVDSNTVEYAGNDCFYESGMTNTNFTNNLAYNCAGSGFISYGENATFLYDNATLCDTGFRAYGLSSLLMHDNATFSTEGFDVGGDSIRLLYDTAEWNVAGFYFEAGGIFAAPPGGSTNIYAQDITAMNNVIGINAFSGVDLVNDTAMENRVYDFFPGQNPLLFFRVEVRSEVMGPVGNRVACPNITVTNMTGSGERQIYFTDVPDTTVPSGTYSEIALCGADRSNVSDSVADGSGALDNNGVVIVQSANVTVSNTTAHDDFIGFFLLLSEGTQLQGGSAYSNGLAGYLLLGADKSDLTGFSSYDNNASLSSLAPLIGIGDGGDLQILSQIPVAFGVLDMPTQSRLRSASSDDQIEWIQPSMTGTNTYTGADIHDNALGAILLSPNDTMSDSNVYDNQLFGIVDASNGNEDPSPGATIVNTSAYRNGAQLVPTFYSLILMIFKSPDQPASGDLPRFPGILYTEYAQGSYVLGGILGSLFGIMDDPLQANNVTWSLDHAVFGNGTSAVTVSAQDNTSTFSYLFSDTNLPATARLSGTYQQFICTTYHNDTDSWFRNDFGDNISCNVSRGGNQSMCDGFQCFNRNETTGQCDPSSILSLLGDPYSFDLNDNGILDTCEPYSGSIAFNFKDPANTVPLTGEYIFVGAAGTGDATGDAQPCDPGGCYEDDGYDCHYNVSDGFVSDSGPICEGCLDENLNGFCDDTEVVASTPEISRFEMFYPSGHSNVKLYMLNITALDIAWFGLNPDIPLNMTMNATWIEVPNQAAGVNSVIVENFTPNGYVPLGFLGTDSIYTGIYGLFENTAQPSGCTGDCGNGGGVTYHILVSTSSCNGNTITVTDTNGRAISGVSVGFENGASLGSTDSSGRVSFPTTSENQCGNQVVFSVGSNTKNARLAPCSDQCSQQQSCDKTCANNERLDSAACACVPLEKTCGSCQYLDGGVCKTYTCDSGQQCAACSQNQVCQAKACVAKPLTCDNPPCCSANTDCQDTESCQQGSCKPVMGICGQAQGHQWVPYTASEAASHCGENGCPACSQPPSGQVTGANCVVGSDCEARSDPGYLVIKDESGAIAFEGPVSGGSVPVPSKIATKYTLTLYSGKGGPQLSVATVNVIPKPVTPEATTPTALLSGSALFFLLIGAVILALLLIYWRMKSGKKK